MERPNDDINAGNESENLGQAMKVLEDYRKYFLYALAAFADAQGKTMIAEEAFRRVEIGRLDMFAARMAQPLADEGQAVEHRKAATFDEEFQLDFLSHLVFLRTRIVVN